uniref:Ion transport domain-containing protein n=1 Tax=Ciona savignyi TaxID=51511 RepID=H2Y8L6_CIOSA
MLGAMNDAGWPSAFYFVSCYLIVDMIVMNLFVAISIEAYKKLARDNTPPGDDLTNNEQPANVNKQVDATLSTTAKNKLNEIFASSRKSRASIGSNTLTGFSSSPFEVRRGTLGSLARSTTPSPRVSDDETMLSVRSQSNSPRRRSVRCEGNGAEDNDKQPTMERRQKMLKQRNKQRRKERR